MDAKETEHEKNGCHPDASSARDNQDRHAGFHALTRAAKQPFRPNAARTRRRGRRLPSQQAARGQSGRIARAVVTSAVQLLSMSGEEVLCPLGAFFLQLPAVNAALVVAMSTLSGELTRQVNRSAKAAYTGCSTRRSPTETSGCKSCTTASSPSVWPFERSADQKRLHVGRSQNQRRAPTRGILQR
jgi:hypothetical protein